MKRILAAFAFLTLLAAPAFAAGISISQIPSSGSLIYCQLPDGTFQVCQADASGHITTSGAPGAFTPLGYQQITSLSTSTALTVPTGSTFALIVAETQAVRWRPDGSTTAPTASVGMPLSAGTPLLYAGDLAAIRFIEQTASAKLDIVYGK